MKVIVTVICLSFLYGCIGGGTLGGFETRIFPTSKKKLVRAIDTFFIGYPEYKLPQKWVSFNDWNARGYDFLDGRIFYFKTDPEEVYYITMYGDGNDSVQADTTKTGISIRAYRNKNIGWTSESDCSRKEKQRVQKRFDEEIVSRIDSILGLKHAKE
ncbi:MAG: hypothetical protein EOP56_08795 [Sphingobacteriales bacterium]|nr:MAG: hypothetical protein EOP56_08795 [Sphingobacteriales bacterium]